MAIAPISAEFKKFHQFAKMEDSADGEPTVWGVATWERPDSDNEICDYETAKLAYQAWSAKALKRTKGAGQELSLGNVRIQHGSEVGGKVTKIHFDDDAKEIWVGSEPISDEVHQALKKGMYTGYSQGGGYAWRSCKVCDTSLPLQQGNNQCPQCDEWVPVRYGLKRIAEVSYVDSPAIEEGFEHVKANGSREVVKFAKKSKPEVTHVANEPKPKREAAEIAARTTKSRDMLKAMIDARAATAGLQKGLYHVGRFADLLESLACLYESTAWEREIEGDESEVPDELKSQLEAMIDTFIAMATEEAKELAAKKSTQPGEKKMTPEEIELQKAGKKTLASHFAKAANHHEKLADKHEAVADHHEAMAGHHDAAAEGCEECMGKSKKADVGDGAEHDAIHEVLENQVEFHKAASKEHAGLESKHDAIAKMHDKFAEHLHKMSESHDEETAKAVKGELAIFDAANPEAAVVKNAPKSVPSMDEDVAAAAAAKRNSPEYKKAISDFADALIQKELEEKRAKTLMPIGTPVGKAFEANGKTFTAVPRDGSADKFEFAAGTTSGNFGGL